MIYEPNTQRWQVGDLVYHDADSKRPHYLMRVVGYTKDGLCRTEYVQQDDPDLRRFGIMSHDLEYLHDPARFAAPASEAR